MVPSSRETTRAAGNASDDDDVVDDDDDLRAFAPDTTSSALRQIIVVYANSKIERTHAKNQNKSRPNAKTIRFGDLRCACGTIESNQMREPGVVEQLPDVDVVVGHPMFDKARIQR